MGIFDTIMNLFRRKKPETIGVSTIALDPYLTTLEQGKTTVISGKLSGTKNGVKSNICYANISIIITGPDYKTNTVSVKTGAIGQPNAGVFTYTFIPAQVGKYYFEIRFAGDTSYGATSAKINVMSTAPVVIEPPVVDPPVVDPPVTPPVTPSLGTSLFSVVKSADKVMQGSKTEFVVQLNGTNASGTWDVDFADVTLEVTRPEGVYTAQKKTGAYGAPDAGRVSYNLIANTVGIYKFKFTFSGDNLYSGCVYEFDVECIAPVGGDIPATTNGTVTVSGNKILIDNAPPSEVLIGINDTTVLQFCIDSFLNGGNTKGRNMNFPNLEGTIPGVDSVKTLWERFFAYCKLYGIKLARIGGHDLWGTTLEYEAWVKNRSTYVWILETMCDEAAKAGVHIILVLAGSQTVPTYTFGGTGSAFDVNSTAYANYITYAKDIMKSLASKPAIAFYDMWNEPDHDQCYINYWKSMGGKAAFNAWANHVAADTADSATHPRLMGVADGGAFFSWGQADFNLATGQVNLEACDRHFYATAEDAYLFSDPEKWAAAVNKPLVWTELGKNDAAPEGYWPKALEYIKSAGGQMVVFMSLRNYPNYPNLKLETSSPPSGGNTSPTVDAKYTVTAKDTNYVVADSSGKQVYTNTNPTTAMNWAFTNLTPNRTSKEKVLLQGDFPISSPIKPNSYTITELVGKVYWNKDSVGLLLSVNNVNNVEVIGGEWDVNQKIRSIGGMDSGGFQFVGCNYVTIKSSDTNKLYIHDSSYGNIRIINCSNVLISGVECGYVGDYGKKSNQVRDAWRGPGMNLFNSNNCIVEKCHVHDVASGGVYFYGEDDGTVQTINNNIMRDNKVERCLTSGLSLSIRGLEDKTDGGLIENNICIDCGEDGDHPGINIGWDDGRLATNTIVRNNQIYTTRGLCESGIEFSGINCTCEGNDCHDLGGPAIHVVGKNNKIINNKANNCGSQGYDGLMVEGTGGNTITGNTITNSTKNGISLYDSSNNIIKNNIIKGFNGQAINIISGTNNDVSNNTS